MTSAIRARREAESGFTLIELLVVVIIIGILAAIAIPAFLNQRERAWQAELTSEIRNYALEVEAEATQDGGSYPAAAGTATAGGSTLADGVELPNGEDKVEFTYALVAGASATSGYSLCGEHDDLGTGQSLTLLGGDAGDGLQPFNDGAGCP